MPIYGPSQSNGDSKDNPYHVKNFFPEITPPRNDYFASLEKYISESIPSQSKIQPKKVAISKLSRLLDVNTETARNMFTDIGTEVDQFCEEEGISVLSSDEKAELLTGMIKAIQGLSKKMGNRLE